jgi:ribonucleoside-diphosphate reductase alpha chain
MAAGCTPRAGARAVDALAQAAWRTGDPGVLFLDTVARDSILAACRTFLATNPCGEQPLPGYGSCCLGSVDLTRFVRRPFGPDAALDASALARTCAVAVRMLDNVIEATAWPLPAQQAQARATRRIGLGLHGPG